MPQKKRLQALGEREPFQYVEKPASHEARKPQRNKDLPQGKIIGRVISTINGALLLEIEGGSKYYLPAALVPRNIVPKIGDEVRFKPGVPYGRFRYPPAHNPEFEVKKKDA